MPEVKMAKYDAIDKAKNIYKAKKNDYKIAKIETFNTKIIEAENDFASCQKFLEYGRDKKEDKLVQNYTQDFTEAIKALADFKVAKGNEALNEGKKDLIKATKYKDYEAKRVARKEILDAKEKIVHSKSWKAGQLYKSAYAQLAYAKEIDNIKKIGEAEESIKDANKTLQESQISKADLLYDIADDRLFYARKEGKPGKKQEALEGFRKYRDIKNMALIIEAKMNLDFAKGE